MTKNNFNTFQKKLSSFKLQYAQDEPEPTGFSMALSSPESSKILPSVASVILFAQRVMLCITFRGIFRQARHLSYDTFYSFYPNSHIKINCK